MEREREKRQGDLQSSRRNFRSHRLFLALVRKSHISGDMLESGLIYTASFIVFCCVLWLDQPLHPAPVLPCHLFQTAANITCHRPSYYCADVILGALAGRKATNLARFLKKNHHRLRS